MTRKVEGLNKLHSQEVLRINPRDASRLGIGDCETVEISSRRGTVTAKTKVSDLCPPGVVSLTFHFAETPTNVLTNSALDPVAKTPETKVCAVKVEKLRT
jgi:predicted molibdopterin-dependent oxidoreductase YjgC